MATVYARLKSHYMFKYQTVFSARFDKQNEDNQRSDETELYINQNVNHNLTKTDLDNINVRFALEEQIQFQEMKDSRGRLDKFNSMTKYFYQTGELNASSYVKSL